MEPIILQTKQITKRFGNFTANDKIDFDLRKGEIHAIAGENGAGKSTLMKILYGVYPRTEGDILVDGEVQTEWNPNLARAKGIGMVFQDFRLIPAFTVTENVFLSLRESGYFLNRKELKKKIREMSDRYELQVDPDAEVWRLDLGQRQHIEIIKLLLQENTRVLIFDEPTSVLAPHEIGAFLEMLSSFRDSLPPSPSPDLVRILLTGETGTPPDLPRLTALAADRWFHAELRDATVVPEALWARTEEDSLTGLFLREMSRRLSFAPEEEHPLLILATRFGLAALEGREDVCP